MKSLRRKFAIYLIIWMMQEIIRTSGHSHALCFSALSYNMLSWISCDRRWTEQSTWRERRADKWRLVENSKEEGGGGDEKVQERKDEGRRGGWQKEDEI